MHAHEIDVGPRRSARATASSSRGETTSTTSQPVGRREHRRDHTLPEPAADDRDLHSPITSGASSCTGRWKRRSAACVSGPDRERDQHGADADVTAEQEADHEHAALERRAHDPEAVAAAR